MFDPDLNCQIQIDKMTAVPAVPNLAVAFRKIIKLQYLENLKIPMYEWVEATTWPDPLGVACQRIFPGPLQKDGGCRKPCSRQRTALVKGAIWIFGPLSGVRRIRVLQHKNLISEDKWSKYAQIISNSILWRAPFPRQGTESKVFCVLTYDSFLSMEGQTADLCRHAGIPKPLQSHDVRTSFCHHAMQSLNVYQL